MAPRERTRAGAQAGILKYRPDRCPSESVVAGLPLSVQAVVDRPLRGAQAIVVQEVERRAVDHGDWPAIEIDVIGLRHAGSVGLLEC